MAPSSKGGPVEQIEIALGEFHEPNQLVDRAEPAAETERTGPFFLHQDREVFAARYVCIFRISLDFCKITQVLQTFLGYIHADGVEDISRRNENFATNHLILGARVTLNIDPVHKRAGALFDLIMHIDPSGTGRRAFGQDRKIDVTAAPVGVGNRFGIIVQLLWRIDAAFLHF